VLAVIAIAEPVIQQHAVIGAVVFVLLSALSAMVVFFSTAVITPIAVDAFGPLTALLLLLAIGIAGVAFSWAVFRRATAMWSSDGTSNAGGS
jgi:uncharacterized membrane protein YdjX (TVP38/TMEM64 family)